MVTKKLFGISFLTFLTVLLMGCNDGLKLKVWFLDSEGSNALVRKQVKEIRLYSQSLNYQCTSPEDFDELMFLLAECRDNQFIQDAILAHAGGTIYSLNEPRGGLVHQEMVLPFKDAHGYLCLSPPDFKALMKVIEDCK